MTPRFHRLLLLIGVSTSVSPLPPATLANASAEVLVGESREVYESRVVPFLKQHCWKCHDEKSGKAGFMVEGLGVDFLAGRTADRWRELADNINLGRMPPEEEPRPDVNEAFAVVEWVNRELRYAEKRAQSMGGRTPMRRLNRTEYANTIRDLLHLDEQFARKIETELPADGKVDGFDRGGAALFVDRDQLQAYLNVGRTVIEEALPTAKPQVHRYRLMAVKDTNLVREVKPKTTMKEVLDRAQQFSNIYAKTPPPEFAEIDRGPQYTDFNTVRDGGVEIRVAGPYTGNFLAYLQRGDIPKQVVKKDGWYKVKLRAGADTGRGKFAVDAVRVLVEYCKSSNEYSRSFEIVIDAPLTEPKEYEQLIYFRDGGPSLEKSLSFTWNVFQGKRAEDAALLMNDQLNRLMAETGQAGMAYQKAGQLKAAPDVLEAALRKRNEKYEQLRQFAASFQGPVYHVNPAVDLKSLPRLWFEYVELEGPLPLTWPTGATKEIFHRGDGEGDREYAREIFAALLPRAYRRPVTATEVDDLVSLVQTMQEKHDKNFGDAVRSAVLTVLTSPSFLFLEEPTGDDALPRAVDDHELASRLSYFLWSSMPDRELLELAAHKKLHVPEVLRAQVRRMAADLRARQFVENFVGQWMRVRDFDTVMVDKRQYPKYDADLREASIREPYEFFHELLRSDLSVLNVLSSDFVMANERLATHYGIAGVKGKDFRRVSLRPEHHRGGVLGMAGLLTYLADGTRTQPVKRGAYVLDVLWNTPAPLPPPNAGDLPVVKGKNLTVRQRLEQHRSVATCASCHARIDPLGLALENYDAVGAWRERQNGEGKQGGRNDPPIDASGVMPGGREFKTIEEFKHALLEERNKFLEGFTEKLLAYAIGRPVGITDRDLVGQVLADAARHDHRLVAMLTAVVESPAFRTK